MTRNPFLEAEENNLYGAGAFDGCRVHRVPATVVYVRSVIPDALGHEPSRATADVRAEELPPMREGQLVTNTC